jgi:hypothetical protein
MGYLYFVYGLCLGLLPLYYESETFVVRIRAIGFTHIASIHIVYEKALHEMSTYDIGNNCC